MPPSRSHRSSASPAPDGDGPTELVAPRVDEELLKFFAEQRAMADSQDPEATVLIDEIERLLRSGGKRLRPAFCYWGFVASGCGEAEETEGIIRVASALELFHTFALIHDDVMDHALLRRKEPTVHVHLAERRRAAGRADPGDFGLAGAILAGDLALVLADDLLASAPFPPEVLASAVGRYGRMRSEVVAGQFLDVAGTGSDVGEDEARRIGFMKSGSYSVLAPLEIGAMLGGADAATFSMIAAYGTPLGEAFQIRDDLDNALRDDTSLDLVEGKPTVLLARARSSATGGARRVLDSHVGRGPMSAEGLAVVRDVLRSTGAVDETVRLQRGLVDRAEEALDPGLAGPASEPLRSLAAALRWQD
ncbi:MAG: polyprenyl synthetase family protein [Actinomycetota bacterium]